MKQVKNIARAAALVAVVFTGLLSCDNPFESNLGEKVDIVPPTLTLESPVPGKDVYIRGVTTFTGKADDDRSVSSVRVSLDSGQTWVPVDTYDPASKIWTYKFDTLYTNPETKERRGDGAIIIRFIAYDNDDKPYESNDFSFYIKNRPPELELNYPALKGANFTNEDALTLEATESSVPATGDALRGVVRDTEGIARDYPKIKFWPKGGPDGSLGDTWEPPDDHPVFGYKVAEIVAASRDQELTAKEFSYSLVDFAARSVITNAAGQEISAVVTPEAAPLPITNPYRFRVVVMDKAGTKKYYPPLEADDDACYIDVGGNYRYENHPGPKPIQVALKESTEKPVITPWYDDGTIGVTGVPSPLPVDEYHSYVGGRTVYKNGDFILQVRVTHSGELEGARLTYDYYPYPYTDDPSAVPSLGDQPLEWDGETLNSGVLFSGTEDPNAGVGIHAKVFTFTSALHTSPPYTLPVSTEGVYVLKVSARSMNAAEKTESFKVFIDRTPPEIVPSSRIIGSFDDQPPYNVNGTIRVTVTTRDTQTQIRSYSGGDGDPDKGKKEQKWILVNPAAKTKLDAALSALSVPGYFPAAGDPLFNDPDFKGKKPAFFEGTFLVEKTTVDSGEPEYDKGPNYLYFFGRDSAFNPYSYNIEFFIDPDSDRPFAESGSESFNLTLGYDGTDSAGKFPPGAFTGTHYPNGPSGAEVSYTNVLSAVTGIPISFGDDDSLDLSPPDLSSPDLSPGGIKITLFTEKEARDGLPGHLFNDHGAKFGTNGSYPSGVRSLQRTFDLADLVNVSPALPGSPPRLPDGKYKLRIEMKDRPDRKEPIDDNPNNDPSVTASKPLEFWFAVDTGGPDIRVPELTDFSLAMNEVNPAPTEDDYSQYLILKGAISDANDVKRLSVTRPKDKDTGYSGELPGDYANAYIYPAASPSTHEPWSDEFKSDGVEPLAGHYAKYGYTWEAKVDMKATIAEQKVIVFEAEDTFGNISTFTLTLLEDQNAPEIQWLREVSTVSGDSLEKVNGIIDFVVNASDQALDGVKYWFLPATAAPPAKTREVWDKTGKAITLGASGYLARINTLGNDTAGNAIVDGADYTLYVMAKDTAHNFSTLLEKQVRVDQTSDYPRYQDLSPTGVIGILTRKITGAVIDDDGFGTTGPYVQVRIYNGTDWSEWKAVTTTTLGAGDTELRFEYEIPSELLGGDGNKQFEIKFRDELTKKCDSSDPEDLRDKLEITWDKANAYYNDGTDGVLKALSFQYDTQEPRVSFSEGQAGKSFKDLPDPLEVYVDEANFDFAKGARLLYSFYNTPLTGLTAAGIDDDSFELPEDKPNQKRYVISKALLEAQLTSAGLSWSALNEGSLDVILRAEDEGGNQGAGQFSFVKDTLGPEITVIAGENNVITETDEPVLRGRFADTSSEVDCDTNKPMYRLYNLSHDGSTETLLNDVPATTPGGWLEFASLAPVANSGNRIVEWSLPLKDIPDGPHRVEIKVSDKALGGNNEGNMNFVASAATLAALVTSGELPSGHGISAQSVTFALDRVQPEIPAAAIVFDPANNVFSDILSGADSDIVFTISGTASDANLLFTDANSDGQADGVTVKIKETSDPAAAALSQFTVDTVTIGETANSGDPVNGYGRTITWKYAVSLKEFQALGPSNTEYTIEITASDANKDKPFTFEQTFIKDAEPPEITLNNMEDKANTLFSDPANRVIRGTVSDENKVKTITASLEEWDYAAAAPAKTADGSHDWTKDPDREWNPNKGTEGDWDKPQAPGWWKEAAADKILDKSSLLASSDPAAANINENWELDLTAAPVDLAEGKYRIKVAAQDHAVNILDSAKVGNPTDSGWKVFFISHTASEPAIEPDIALQYFNGAIALKGTAWDTNLIQAVWGKIGDSDFLKDDGTLEDGVIVAAYTDTNSGASQTDAKAWNLSLPVPSGGDNRYTVYLQVTDYAGRATVVTQNITVDSVMPGFTVIAPLDPPGHADYTGDKNNTPLDAAYEYDSYVKITGSYDIRGSVNDTVFGAGSGIKDVAYLFGVKDIADYDTATPEDKADFWRTAGIAGIVDFDFSGSTWRLNLPNSNLLKTGASPGTLGGGSGGTPNDYVSWVDPRDTALDAVTGQPKLEDEEMNVWLLPVKFRVTDGAGNEQIYTRYYWIDPDGDLAKVTIQSPNASQMVSAQEAVYISGTGTDNDQVRNFSFRVLHNPAGDGTPWTPLDLSASFSADGFAPDPDAGMLYTDGLGTGWYYLEPATSPSSMVGWTIPFNTQGQIDGADFTEFWPANGLYPVKIEILAWDNSQDRNARKDYGPVAERIVLFERGYPEFTDINITYQGADLDYEDSPTMKGAFVIKASVQDESGIYENGLKWRGGGTGEYTVIPVVTETPASGSYAKKVDETHYTIVIPLDPDDFGADYKSGAKKYTVEIQAADVSQPRHITTEPLELRIDNFTPLSEYTGTYSAIGDHYTIQGRAWDTGEGADFGKLSRLVAWFKTTDGFAPLSSDTGSHPWQPGATVKAHKNRYITYSGGNQTIKEDLDTGDNPEWSITLPNISADSYLGIEINGPAVASDSVPQGNNTTKGWNAEGNYIEWLAQVDLTQLPGGPLVLCYVLFDSAGNAVYYEQPLMNQTGAPMIHGILVGTNLYNGPAHQDGEDEYLVTTNYEDITYPDNTPFTIWNNDLFVRAIVSGESPRKYRLSYINSVSGTAVGPEDLTPGEFYQIATLGDTNWEPLGAPDNPGTGTIFMATGKLPENSAGTGAGTARLVNRAGARKLAPAVNEQTYTGPGFVDGEGNTVTVKTQVLEYLPAGDHFSKDGSGAGNADKIWDTTAADPGPRKFILQVYDDPGTGSELNSRYSYIIFGVHVSNYTSGKPAVQVYDLNPATETGAIGMDPAGDPGTLNRTRPGLYNKGSLSAVVRSGHIEPRKTTTLSAPELGISAAQKSGLQFTVDTVSGEVILRGNAKDDHLVRKITITFGGTDVDILTWDAVDKRLKGGRAYTKETLSMRGGHQVEWAYVWDTQTHPANVVVADEVTVRAGAVDVHSGPEYNTSDTTTQGVNNANYNSVNFNLVPFILGFTRASANNQDAVRTKMGWFPLLDNSGAGETVTLTGYNLKAAGTTVVTIADTTLAPAGTPSPTALPFTIPVNTKSGAVKLTTSTGTADINRHTDKTSAAALLLPWNRENRGSQAWTSAWDLRRNVRIWRSHDAAGGSFPNSEMAEYPAMSINSSGTLQGSWTHPDQNGMYTGDTTSSSRVFRWYDPPDETDIHYSSSGWRTVVFNNVGAYGNGANQSSTTGGLAVYDGNSDTAIGGMDSSGDGYNVENVYRTSTDHTLDRFKNPHIVTNGNYMHVSYHDRIDRSLKYWFGESGKDSQGSTNHGHSNVGGTAAPKNPIAASDGIQLYDKRWINLDGGWNYYDDYPKDVPDPKLKVYNAPTTIPAEDMTMKTGVNVQYMYFTTSPNSDTTNYPFHTYRYVSNDTEWGPNFAVNSVINPGDLLFYTGSTQALANSHSTGNFRTVNSRVYGKITAVGVTKSTQVSNNTWVPVVTVDTQHLAYRIGNYSDYTGTVSAAAGTTVTVGDPLFNFGRASGSRNDITYRSPIRADVKAVAVQANAGDTSDLARFPFITVEKLAYTAAAEAGGATYQPNEYDYLDFYVDGDRDYSGTVNVKPGQIVKAGTPLFTYGASESARYGSYFRATADMKILAVHVVPNFNYYNSSTSSDDRFYIPVVTYAPVTIAAEETEEWYAYTPTAATRFIGNILVAPGAVVEHDTPLFNYGDSYAKRNDNTALSRLKGEIEEVLIKGDSAWPATEDVALFKFKDKPKVLADTRVRDKDNRQDGDNGYGQEQSPSGRPDAGYHNAIALDKDNKPVIAYYDAKNGNLKLAWSGVTHPVRGDDWTVEEVTAANSRIGEFVSLKIHTDNILHIAAKNGSNQLVYIRGAPKDGGGWTYSAPVVVDNAGSVGTWADISLDSSGNPWITYRENTGARNSVKMAYLPGGKGGYAAPDNWETMAVPNRYDALDARLSIENYTGTWKAAIGYRAADKYRISYFIDE